MKRRAVIKTNKSNKEHTTRAIKKSNQILHFLRKHCSLTESAFTRMLAVLTRKHGTDTVFAVLKWRRNNKSNGYGLEITNFRQHFKEAKDEFDAANEIRPAVLQAIHDLENE